MQIFFIDTLLFCIFITKSILLCYRYYSLYFNAIVLKCIRRWNGIFSIFVHCLLFTSMGTKCHFLFSRQNYVGSYKNLNFLYDNAFKASKKLYCYKNVHICKNELFKLGSSLTRHLDLSAGRKAIFN